MNRRVRTLQHRLQPGLGGHTCAHRAHGKWAPQSASVRFPARATKFPRDSRCRPFQ
jgi:hypothetical protein